LIANSFGAFCIILHLQFKVFDFLIVIGQRIADLLLERIDLHEVREEGEDVFDFEALAFLEDVNPHFRRRLVFRVVRGLLFDGVLCDEQPQLPPQLLVVRLVRVFLRHFEPAFRDHFQRPVHRLFVQVHGGVYLHTSLPLSRLGADTKGVPRWW
jgi:hypothetical protein